MAVTARTARTARTVAISVVLFVLALFVVFAVSSSSSTLEGYDSRRFIDTRYGRTRTGTMMINGLPATIKFDTKLRQYVYLPPGKLGTKVYYKVDPYTKRWVTNAIGSASDATCEAEYAKYKAGTISRSRFESACSGDPMHRDYFGEPPPSPLDAMYPRTPGTP